MDVLDSTLCIIDIFYIGYEMQKKKNTKIITNILEFLLIPTKWFIKLPKKITIMCIVSFYVSGYILHQNYNFPYFECYTCIFSTIVLITIGTITYHNKNMPIITVSTAIMNSQQPANSFYYRYVYKNVFYIIFPICILFIFGFGGCAMFGTISINPLFVWIMLLFSFVVYISIVGYLQYIFFAIYIYKMASSKFKILNLHHSLNECIPADLEWIQSLAKLSHIFRTAFFLIGCLYIIAFGAFCYLPDFMANRNSVIYFILWGIIFVAIVFTFPIISLLEHKWIKTVVKKLKDAYISDLKKETDLLYKNSTKRKFVGVQAFFLENIYALKIMESRDYPISSLWNTGYCICLAVFNFLAAITTVLQGVPMFLNDFHQIP